MEHLSNGYQDDQFIQYELNRAQYPPFAQRTGVNVLATTWLFWVSIQVKRYITNIYGLDTPSKFKYRSKWVCSIHFGLCLSKQSPNRHLWNQKDVNLSTEKLAGYLDYEYSASTERTPRVVFLCPFQDCGIDLLTNTHTAPLHYVSVVHRWQNRQLTTYKNETKTVESASVSPSIIFHRRRDTAHITHCVSTDADNLVQF